ncbi:hypothetical protein HYFRA_00000676 [Hymenoscyphus fraxineus]|uniref:Uncharacterized protein n=1 Tax=Hymenoscyphus fraxineus TaxID=746836 RepID=A0A9N9L2K4_9HELO|nr:hypothetical protein HYFRA_00000676 [Hymenoscyphus fraxineus]
MQSKNDGYLPKKPNSAFQTPKMLQVLPHLQDHIHLGLAIIQGQSPVVEVVPGEIDKRAVVPYFDHEQVLELDD